MDMFQCGSRQVSSAVSWLYKARPENAKHKKAEEAQAFEGKSSYLSINV